MRTLKLQVQISVNGFIAKPGGGIRLGDLELE